MNKHKKMLLIALCLAVVSCGPGLPNAPEVLKVTPIWGEGDVVKYFYGKWMKANEKVTLSNGQARAMGMICTDADSEARAQMYAKELKHTIETRCKCQ